MEYSTGMALCGGGGSLATMTPERGGRSAVQGDALAAGFLSALWAARSTTLIAVAAGLFSALLYLAVIAFLAPGSTSYRQAIALNVPGAKAGYYPNGTRFSPTDLRGAAILKQAHAASGLERYGVTFVDFDAALTVRSYSPAMDQANLRFRSLMAQPAITLDDRRRLEDEYLKTIAEIGGDGALVTLALRDDQAVPADVAKAALAALLNEWSRLHIDRLGVAAAPNARDSALLLDEAAIAALDVPMAHMAIIGAQADLEARVRRLGTVPGFSDISAGTGKRTLMDVDRDAATVGTVLIAQVLTPIAKAGLARDPSMAKLTMSSLIGEDRIRAATLEQSIRRIDEIVAQADATRAGGTAGDGNTTVQLGDATVSRLVDLAVENADLPFRRSLLDEKRRLGEALQAQTASIALRSVILAAIQSAETAPLPNAAALAATFESAASTAAAAQNRLWAELNQLAELTGGADVNTDKQLYLPLQIRDAEMRSGGLRDMAVWLKAAIILATFAAGGLLLQLGRSALKSSV